MNIQIDLQSHDLNYPWAQGHNIYCGILLIIGPNYTQGPKNYLQLFSSLLVMVWHFLDCNYRKCPAVVAWWSRSSTFSFRRSLSPRARWIESRFGNGVTIVQTQKYVEAIQIAERRFLFRWFTLHTPERQLVFTGYCCVLSK